MKTVRGRSLQNPRSDADSETGSNALEPFLKWPGGKRWLASRVGALLPARFNRYIEPFVGSGAIFFHISPESAILADANSDLINAYRQLRRFPGELHERLLQLHDRHSSDLYYSVRAMQPTSAFERAVQFVYLNRTCFNGIYRVNRYGRFNVPMGSKTEVAFRAHYLNAVARLLRRARLEVADFEVTIGAARRGDVVFVDPPYTVMHNTNNFVKYNARLFSWADQERLADAVRRAAARGAAIIVSNANHVSVRRLYKGFGTQRVVGRASVLAADSERRVQTTELLVTSY